MFEKISIENYKSIKTLPDFEMKPVNILIGANNSGKSNFLDAFAFLRDTVTLYNSEDESGWRAALARRGGLDSVTHQSTKQFKIEACSTAFQYSLAIEDNSWSARLRNETLQNRSTQETIFKLDQEKNGVLFYRNGQWSSTSYGDGYTGLRYLMGGEAHNYDERAYDFAKQISEIKIYDRLRTEIWSPVRTPQKPKGETILDEDGSNLVGVLYQLGQTQPRIFLERLNSLLHVVFDDFAQDSFPSNGQGELLIRWEDKSGRISNASQLSDGTLKFLCLIAILKNPNPPAFIGIDEIDANLHPKMQSILADIIAETSRKTQIVATTHNPEFLSMFTPEEIVVLVKHKGETELRRFSTKGALDLWMEDFGTRELWLMGELESRW